MAWGLLLLLLLLLASMGRGTGIEVCWDMAMLLGSPLENAEGPVGLEMVEGSPWPCSRG